MYDRSTMAFPLPFLPIVQLQIARLGVAVLHDSKRATLSWTRSEGEGGSQAALQSRDQDL